MNKSDRIEKLENIMKELDTICLNYIPEWPPHRMICMAMGFLHSLIILESDEDLDPIKVGIIVPDDEVHRGLKIENGKVTELT